MRLLFDLDGTLTDPSLGITNCIRHALGELGALVPPAGDLLWCIGPPLHESFKILLDTDDDEPASEALAIYRERFGTVGLFENEVYPGVINCLKALSTAGHVLSVATSKPTVFAKRIIDHFELSEFFVAVDGSELDGTRGDKKSLIAHILERDTLQPEKVMMIGDRKYDMTGAAENGVRGVGVLWGFGSHAELSNAGAALCIDHVSELPGAVAEVAAG